MKFVIFTILFAGSSFALPQLLGKVVDGVGGTVGGLLGKNNGGAVGSLLGVGQDNDGLLGKYLFETKQLLLISKELISN